MPVIGITGGISTGKTTFCDCLRQILPAAKFFNADQVAHELTALEEVKKEITAEFGSDAYTSAGDLNRERLRAIVFQDASKKSALEQILHPRIRRQWSSEGQTYRHSPEFFLADIPLLYETGGEILCDRVVVVACSPEVQLARLLQREASVAQLSKLRPGQQQVGNLLHKSAAEQMIKSQMPLAEKIKLADHVVWNNDGVEGLMDQAQLLVRLWQR